MSLDSFEIGQQLGDLNARMQRVETHTAAVHAKLDLLVLAAAEKKGERRMLALFATAMGGVGSFLMTIILKLVDR